MTLYEFQQNTLYNVERAQQNKPIVVLSSEEGTGKSTILQNVNKVLIRDTGYAVIKCMGSAAKAFTDYGCLPEELLKEIKEKIRRKSLGNNLILDLLGTIGNVVFVQTENFLVAFCLKMKKKIWNRWSIS